MRLGERFWCLCRCRLLEVLLALGGLGEVVVKAAHVALGGGRVVSSLTLGRRRRLLLLAAIAAVVHLIADDLLHVGPSEALDSTLLSRAHTANARVARGATSVALRVVRRAGRRMPAVAAAGD